jgi:periplasmic copper chaperone A
MCIIAGGLTLAGCGKPAALAVDAAWVRLPAVPGRPAAAYFTLHGGPADATLIAVATPGAARAELHESMANGMRRAASVPLAAAGSVSFTPGDRHVMLFDVNPRLKPGASVPLTLSFADGRTLTASAKVVGAADPAP